MRKEELEDWEEEYRKWISRTCRAEMPPQHLELYSQLRGVECAQPAMAPVCDAVVDELRRDRDLIFSAQHFAKHYAWNAGREAY